MSALQQMARRAAPWLGGDAPQRDIVLSSRVRLARNVEGWRFTHSNGDAQLRELRDELVELLVELPSLAGARGYDMERLSELERRFLLERHLVSVDLLRHANGRGVVVDGAESLGVMVNEEDHLRVQAFCAGLDPGRALRAALGLASELQEELPLAFSERLGYLTACPTNVGTGLRASILVHLPALGITGDMERVLNGLRRLNFTVRGFYGEGSGAMGSLFQVSNSVTLGPSEEEIVAELLEHTGQVIACERAAREALHGARRASLEDRAWRAWGQLRHARLLPTREAFELLGDVRLGTTMGILPALDEAQLNVLLMGVQSAHLQVAAGAAMDAGERDAARARYLRGWFARAAHGEDAGE